jgi:hypothetical protein
MYDIDSKFQIFLTIFAISAWFYIIHHALVKMPQLSFVRLIIRSDDLLLNR